MLQLHIPRIKYHIKAYLNIFQKIFASSTPILSSTLPYTLQKADLNLPLLLNVSEQALCSLYTNENNGKVLVPTWTTLLTKHCTMGSHLLYNVNIFLCYYTLQPRKVIKYRMHLMHLTFWEQRLWFPKVLRYYSSFFLNKNTKLVLTDKTSVEQTKIRPKINRLFNKPLQQKHAGVLSDFLYQRSQVGEVSLGKSRWARKTLPQVHLIPEPSRGRPVSWRLHKWLEKVLCKALFPDSS